MAGDCILEELRIGGEGLDEVQARQSIRMMAMGFPGATVFMKGT